MTLAELAVLRAIGFFVVWIMLSGGNPADLATGVVAAGLATRASLRLMPPNPSRVRPVALARLAMRFLHQSVVAGLDVARRALDPRLPLHTGFVIYPVGLPPGSARQTFTALISLLPGTVPIGARSDKTLLVHCLDVEQPVAVQLAAEEVVFVRVIGGSPRHG